MSLKIVIDTDSIINYLRYYSFDKHDKGIIYEKLEEFILSRIAKEEIIVIDKVFKELRRPETKDFKGHIKKYIYNTEHLINDIEPLFEENIVEINKRLFADWEFVSEKSQYTEKFADLYFIALCKYLKTQNNDVILITEETISTDRKLVEKIPTICERNEIECRNLPYMLFSIYKDELIFDLKIKN